MKITNAVSRTLALAIWFKKEKENLSADKKTDRNLCQLDNVSTETLQTTLIS